LFIVPAANDGTWQKNTEVVSFQRCSRTDSRSFFRLPQLTDMETVSTPSTSISATADTANMESSSSITTTTVSNAKSPPLSLSNQTASRPSSPEPILLKQLDKIRRFLSTLYHFGTDISNEIGERVRALILALIVRDLLCLRANKYLFFVERRFIRGRISWKTTSSHQLSIETVRLAVSQGTSQMSTPIANSKVSLLVHLTSAAERTFTTGSQVKTNYQSFSCST
jgi:hypothetical protein